MPHFWNNILVVKIDELVPQFYSNEKSISNACGISEKRGYGMRRVRAGGGPGHPALIEFDSLDNSIKVQIGDPRIGKHPLELFFNVDRETTDWYKDYLIDGSILHMTDETIDKCIANASVLKACIALKEARENERSRQGDSLRGVMKSVYNDAMSFIPVLKTKYKMEARLPEAESRFNEAFKKFSDIKYISLVPKTYGNTNRSKSSDMLFSLLNDMFAGQTEKPSFAKISKQYEAFLDGYVEVIDNETGELYSPSGFPRISRGSVYNYLHEYENLIGNTAKRAGDRQRLIQNTVPYHDLLHPEFAGSIISIDDRQPPFEYAKGRRMWFYNGIDLGSEAFTVWVYGKTKEGIILEFYRQMVRNYHDWGFQLPHELECESSLNSMFRDTFLREGYMFERVRIEANKARAKRIEAYYKPLRYQLEKMHEGWLSRPFALDESNQAGPGDKILIPYDKLADQCLGDIETWNNMPHSVHKDKTRWEVFCEKQHPKLRQTNYKTFLRNLGFHNKIQCRAGILNLNSARFLLGDNGTIYTGSKLIELMKVVEGETVDVYWLDDNQGSVLKALIYMNDKFICEALPKPAYSRGSLEFTEKDAEARETMSKYSTTIEAYMRDRKNTVNRVTVIDNTPLTLNNKFQIAQLHKRPETANVEVLPEPEEDYYLNTVETSFKTSLADRF